MLKKLSEKIKTYPGFCILILILLVISFTNIKPDFYLLGWDNYSSYFNLKTNIFRTFFATWREYRGLGVPSDAEVTDVFRQIFFYGLHFIIPEQLFEQVYYLFALWIGILAMYFLTRLLSKKIEIEKKDIFATAASLFYLFNLNTLSVFYSPIIPFINRFYSLPLTLFLFLRLTISKDRLRDSLILALVIITTSGSYITPTVFITSFIAFFIFLLFNLNIKKIVIYLFIFLLLNAFWILPFLNYAFNKSSIIPLARTFIEINESTLNQSKNEFSLEKQSILYPSFFNIEFFPIKGTRQLIYPQLNEYQKPINQKIFLLFPILYGLGSILIILFWKENKKVLWIPLWIFLFLLLSQKTYGPLGFIYLFLTKYIPYFGIIFRIADTKFHAYISLAGSIAAAYAVVYLTSSLRRRLFIFPLVVGILLTSLCYIWLFRGYFNGNLINFLVYTKIPKVYFQIADKINGDRERGRVLHLPFDSWHHYWRSYSWGYVGSAFFNYMLNKPYIDKTFEPASMENSYLHSKINLLLDLFYRAADPSEKSQLATRFLTLLEQTGIKYVLVDHSISAEIFSRNLIYSAKQLTINANQMMNYLYRQGKIANRSRYKISLSELYPAYQKLYPVNISGLPDNLPTETAIDLYELKSVQPVFSFISSAKLVDPKLDNLLETDIDQMTNGHLMQDENKPAQLFPFFQQNHQAVLDNNSVVLQYPNTLSPDFKYTVSVPPSPIDSYLIDVYGAVKNNQLKLDFFYRYNPTINEQSFQKYIGSLTFPASPVDRLQLNDVFIPFPTNISDKQTFFTSYMLHEKTIRATLLQKSASQTVDLRSANKLTSSQPSFIQLPVVFPDKIGKSNQYLEVELVAKGETNDENKPIHGYVCIRPQEGKDCLNLHRNFQIFKDSKRYLITTQNLVNGQVPLIIEIGSLPFDNLTQSITVDALIENFYQLQSTKTLSFTPDFPQEAISLSGPLTISFPKAASYYSYFHDPSFELFDNTLEPCYKTNKKNRIVRYYQGKIYNSMENCNMTFAQQFQYCSQYPYLFTYDYWLGSGQQPVLHINQKSDVYLMERVSLYQGYPKVRSGTASRLVGPRSSSDSHATKISATFSQDTANEGLFALGSFNIIEYPAAWYRLSLKPAQTDIKYTLPQEDFTYKSILPSLWRLEFSQKPQANKSLLLFNEGYDKQWKLYESFWDLLIGKEAAKSVRCDGFANCFEVRLRSRNYYIFYTPEKLSFLGWGLTIATFLIITFFLLKKPINSLSQ